MTTEARGPFLVDYLLPDGRHFSFTLEGPESWQEAEAHLKAIQRFAWIEGSDAETIRSNVVTLWIDGLAAWLRTKWRQFRGL